MKKFTITLVILVILLSMLFLFLPITKSNDSVPHICKGTLFLNNETAPEGILIRINFSGEYVSTNTFANENGFNYNLGFFGYNNKTGTIAILYENEVFYPKNNKTVKLSKEIDRCYFDIYVESEIFDRDITPPSKVTGLKVLDAKDGKLDIKWNKATDNVAVDYYEIYRQNKFIKKTSLLIYQDKNLDDGKNYSYKVRAVDKIGNKGDFSDDVNGTPTKLQPTYKPPQANAEGPYNSVVNRKITFSGSVKNGKAPYSYAWDFGDGEKSNNKNPKHSYKQSGIYNVRFTVTDDQGKSDTEQVKVNIEQKKINHPDVKLSGPNLAVIGEEIQFEGEATSGNPPFVLWRWEFGDGNISNAQSPTHIYSRNGTYTVTLTVTDNIGLTDTSEITIKINELNKTQGKDILDHIVEFFGGMGDFLIIEGNIVHFIPIAILGIALIVGETALVFFIRKKGFFKK